MREALICQRDASIVTPARLDAADKADDITVKPHFAGEASYTCRSGADSPRIRMRGMLYRASGR